MAFLSKPRLLKHIFYNNSHKPLFRLCSSSPIPQNPDPNPLISTPESQPGIIKNDAQKTDFYKKVEILCKDKRYDDAKHIILGMSEKGIDYNEDLFILLINGYAKSTKKWDIVKNCVKIFIKMEELGVSKTVNFYNKFLEVIVSEKKYTLAAKYFSKMLDEGVVPNKDTYSLMISGLCLGARVEGAKLLFEDMKSRGLLPGLDMYNSMIYGYVEGEIMDDAEKIFMEMKGAKVEPDLASYNLMIDGYARVRKMEDVERLVVEMKGRNIEPDLKFYNLMINGYSLVEKMEDAEKVVLEMKGRRIEGDLVTYVSRIIGYVKGNRIYDGLKLFEKMKRKFSGRKVDVYPCLVLLKEDSDSENMSESQRNVLQEVEDYVERLELLAMRDAARELSELVSRRVVDAQVE